MKNFKIQCTMGSTLRIITKIFTCIAVALLFGAAVYGQNLSDTLKAKNIYKPGITSAQKAENTADILNVERQNYNAGTGSQMYTNIDSLREREEFVQDSIIARLKFIQDSVEARLAFIQDSLQRRQRILDSLTLLKRELPMLLEAFFRTVHETTIVSTGNIEILGDSMLGNFTYMCLPFGLDQPFHPWKSDFNLSERTFNYSRSKKTGKIEKIQSSFLTANFNYNEQKGILKIMGLGTYISNHGNKYFKEPADSVFFDNQNRIIKIKKYISLFVSNNNLQKGAFILTSLKQVKQFEYSAGRNILKEETVNFCNQWTNMDKQKVCNRLSYTISKEGNIYKLTRQNDPANGYSDGNFVFDFDIKNNLKTVTFNNLSKSDDWKTFIDLDEDCNVIRYVYQIKGVVNSTLLINYSPKNSLAKNKFETISCSFENDGVSYFQKNNTTGKQRFRDKMTLEWSDWK